MPYTLLLADDSVTIQRVIELTFADEDVTVVAVGDGDQAIERLEASPPDIVLADIGMPGKNGYEVAQYVRRSPKLAHIPVMLLTGAFEPVDQARADDAGCDGVLAKPFEPQLVIGRVKELLNRPHRGQDAAARTEHAAADAAAEPQSSSTSVAPAAVDYFNRGGPAINDSPAPTADQTPPSAATPAPQLNDYFDRLDAAFSKLPSASSPTEAKPLMEDRPDVAIAAPPKDFDWFRKNHETDNTGSWSPPAPSTEAVPDLPLSYASPQPEATAVLALQESFASVAAVEPAAETVPVVEALVQPPAVAAPDERLAPIEESAPVEPVAAPAASVIAAEEPAATPSQSSSLPAAPALELPVPNAPPLPPLADAFAALLAAEKDQPPPVGALWPAVPAPPAHISDEVIETIIRRVLERLSDTVVRTAVSDIASQVAERLVREEIERIKASIK